MSRILVLLLFTVGSWAYEARYDNYRVYSIIPETNEQLNNIRLLEQSSLPLDFWWDPVLINDTIDVIVPPHKEAQFHEIVSNFKLRTEVKIDNVQRLVDEEYSQMSKVESKYGWTKYYNLSAINQWLEDIAAKHSQHVKVITVGHTYQGRPIKGVKVSFKTGNKAVFIEGGIHAREWIAPSTVTYILNQILTSRSFKIRRMARSYDWYIVPTVNPDGYDYTFNVNRFWRKTRVPYGPCVGADANRNWDFHWNETGVTGPCEQFYAGAAPFSEPEMKSLSEYIASVSKDLVVYLAFHSFGQQLLIPYSHGEYCENFSELMEIGEKVVATLEKRHGTKFTVGNWKEVMYASSGVSVDWVKGVLKVPITYTYELRDTGNHGFVLPTNQIIPVGEEIVDSLVTLIREVKRRGY